MKLKQAARQALEALETQQITSDANWDTVYKAITALREALDHSVEATDMVQEPMAWKDMAFARLGVVRDKMRPEDVAVVQRFLDGDYAASVRTKDLTDDEIDSLWAKVPNQALYKAVGVFARAVIAADREKNK